MLVVGLPMREAVATSLLVIAINCATALLARLSGGVQIDWLIVIPFAFVAVLGSLLGARLAKGVNQAVLGQAFAGLLLIIGLVMAVENFPQVF
ncbi:MAG: sulfite exporter TauE/SafE family protein [Marmoricola sp.]